MLKYLIGLTAVFAFKLPNRKHVTLDMCTDDNEYCSAFPKNTIPLNATMDTFEEVLYTANSTKVLFYGDITTSLRWYLLSRPDNLTKVYAVDKELQQHLNMNTRTPFSMVYVKMSNNGNYYYETYSWNTKTWTPSRMFEIFIKAEEESLIPEYMPVHHQEKNHALNLTYFPGNTFIHPMKIWVVLYYANEMNEHTMNIAKWFNIIQPSLGPNIELFCHDLGIKKASIELDYVPSVVLYSSYHKDKQSHIKLTPPITLQSIAFFIDSNINLKMSKEFKIFTEEDVDRVLEEYK